MARVAPQHGLSKGHLTGLIHKALIKPSRNLSCLVKIPFQGLKAALYYGCLLSRPEWITGFDVTRHERFLEGLMRALGISPVRWPLDRQCCGATLAITRPEISDRLVDRIRGQAERAGAQCLAVFCSLCQMNLEMRGTTTPRMPVVYVTELLGAAMGSPSLGKWMARHLVDPVAILGRLRGARCG
jgi:heterodisulfide reductase subunit B